MFQVNFLAILAGGVSPFFLILALFWGAFLFWRAGRHELVENEFLFDLIIGSFLGALVFGRIFDFLTRTDFYDFSLKRLFFFNVYFGFNFYGALFGIILSVFLFLRKKRGTFWFIFDLASCPLAFLMSLVSLGKFLGMSISARGFAPKMNNIFLYYFIGYFLIFWILKRLSGKKRNEGFFASVFLIFVAILNFGIFNFKKNVPKIAGIFPFELIFCAVILTFGLFWWYVLAKRSIKRDIRSILAFFLLLIFKMKRIFLTVEEANAFAKSIIFSPYYLVKLIFFYVKLIGREVVSGFSDLFYAFKAKR